MITFRPGARSEKQLKISDNTPKLKKKLLDIERET